jgi:hypothetical protein
MGQAGWEISFDEMDEAALALLEQELSVESRRALSHLFNNSLFVVTLSLCLFEAKTASNLETACEIEHLTYAVRRLQALVGRITHREALVDAGSSLRVRT